MADDATRPAFGAVLLAAGGGLRLEAFLPAADATAAELARVDASHRASVPVAR